MGQAAYRAAVCAPRAERNERGGLLWPRQQPPPVGIVEPKLTFRFTKVCWTLCRNAKAVEISPADTDRYGRTVAHVRCDGVQVNWRQVEDGLAWCYPRYLKQPAECLPREKAAREAKKGLWAEANPQAPWEFRAAKQQQK